MILYNIKELESQIIANTLPQKHVFIYAVILLTFSSLSALSFGSDEPVDLWANNMGVILAAIITIGFTIHLYNLCKEHNQEDRFFEYYFSIGLVMVVRLFVFAFVLSIPIGVLSFLISPDYFEGYDLIVDLTMTTLIGFIYYIMMIRSFNRVLLNSSRESNI